MYSISKHKTNNFPHLAFHDQILGTTWHIITSAFWRVWPNKDTTRWRWCPPTSFIECERSSYLLKGGGFSLNSIKPVKLMFCIPWETLRFLAYVCMKHRLEAFSSKVKIRVFHARNDLHCKILELDLHHQWPTCRSSSTWSSRLWEYTSR